MIKQERTLIANLPYDQYCHWLRKYDAQIEVIANIYAAKKTIKINYLVFQNFLWLKSIVELTWYFKFYLKLIYLVQLFWTEFFFK